MAARGVGTGDFKRHQPGKLESVEQAAGRQQPPVLLLRPDMIAPGRSQLRILDLLQGLRLARSQHARHDAAWGPRLILPAQGALAERTDQSGKACRVDAMNFHVAADASRVLGT